MSSPRRFPAERDHPGRLHFLTDLVTVTASLHFAPNTDLTDYRLQITDFTHDLICSQILLVAVLSTTLAQQGQRSARAPQALVRYNDPNGE